MAKTQIATPRGASGRASAKSTLLKKNIMDVALSHFSECGFEGTSLRAVAKEANTSHPLLLYHFASKEALWQETMADIVGGYSRSIVELFDSTKGESAAEALQQFIERFVIMSSNKPEVHRVLTMASTQNSARVEWLVETYLREHFEIITSCIRKAQKEGAVREGDPAQLYYHIIGAAGTPFTLYKEFKLLTGRDVFSDDEIHQTTQFIIDSLFLIKRK